MGASPQSQKFESHMAHGLLREIFRILFLLPEARLQWLTAHREIVGMRHNFGRPEYPLWRIYRDVARHVLVPDFVRALKRRLTHQNFDWIQSRFFVSQAFSESTALKQRWQANVEACSATRFWSCTW